MVRASRIPMGPRLEKEHVGFVEDVLGHMELKILRGEEDLNDQQDKGFQSFKKLLERLTNRDGHNPIVYRSAIRAYLEETQQVLPFQLEEEVIIEMILTRVRSYPTSWLPTSSIEVPVKPIETSLTFKERLSKPFQYVWSKLTR